MLKKKHPLKYRYYISKPSIGLKKPRICLPLTITRLHKKGDKLNTCSQLFSLCLLNKLLLSDTIYPVNNAA